MRIWALEHGIYQLTTGPDADGDQLMDAVERGEFLELAKADRIDLTLAPKAVTMIEIEQANRLERIFDRADLAIVAREVQVGANTLVGVVHNIGYEKGAAAAILRLIQHHIWPIKLSACDMVTEKLHVCGDIHSQQ